MKQQENPDKGLQFPLKLVGRIALLVSLAAVLILAVMLMFIGGESGRTYLDVIRAYRYTQDALGPALTIAGLALLAITGLLTWLVTLYGSFRIAGPLYRMQCNLEQSRSFGPIRPIPIRGTDRLQTEADALARANTRLRNHYDELRSVAAQAMAALDSDQAAAAWPKAVQRLQELDRRVQL